MGEQGKGAEEPDEDQRDQSQSHEPVLCRSQTRICAPNENPRSQPVAQFWAPTSTVVIRACSRYDTTLGRDA